MKRKFKLNPGVATVLCVTMAVLCMGAAQKFLHGIEVTGNAIVTGNVAAGGDISGAVDMVTLVGVTVVEASTGFDNADFVLD